MTHGAGIADYYAERAADYELIYERPERQADLGRLRGRVEAFGRDRHVAEVASGTGYWTRLLASTVRTVVATDVGDVVLGLARARGLPGHVAIQRADAFALAEVTGDFDAAFAGFWWSHVPRDNLSRFLDGLHARLGGGASVLFLDSRYDLPVPRRGARRPGRSRCGAHRGRRARARLAGPLRGRSGRPARNQPRRSQAPWYFTTRPSASTSISAVNSPPRLL
jgi:SAM-dependent methyltransferase